MKQIYYSYSGTQKIQNHFYNFCYIFEVSIVDEQKEA